MSGEPRYAHAQTAPESADPDLRGLTCAVPFDDVWQITRRLVGGELRGWTLLAADDAEGRIDARCRSLTGVLHDVVIRISLDEDAQTRVDAMATALKPGADFGRARRAVKRYFRSLGAALQQRTPRQPAARQR